MKNFIIAFSTILLCGFLAKAQVGIGTNTPSPSSALDMTSINKGLLIPRLTQAQRLVIASPAEGLLVYQTDAVIGFWYYDGTTWMQFAPLEVWGLTGNAGSNAGTNFIGTTDSQDFVFRTDEIEAMRVTPNGRVGIGTPNPQNTLHIESASGTPALRIDDGNQAVDRVLTSDATGNATWMDVPAGSSSTNLDPDWNFVSGVSNTDPIYRTGNVRIGGPSEAMYLLDVQRNELEMTTTVGIGGTEFIEDDIAEFKFSGALVPLNNNTIPFGDAGAKWAVFFANNATINTSDRREKEDITPLAYTSSDVLKIKPVTYQWKNEIYGSTVVKGSDKMNKIGFLAQNLKKVIPESVIDYEWVRDPVTKQWSKKQIDVLGVNYNEILPLVVKSIQEKQYLIDELKQEQKEIKELLKSLE